jgi:DNA mismatch repair ATPase MutS
MDNYSSLAEWYTALHTSSSNPLCFAQLNTAPRPFVHITDFWHVLARNNPHLNSIKLGSGSPQNAIITGVFESGKSTVLQAVALNIVCAQSIGICLAKEMHATPYASINIYANIKDDLASGRSLFRTELYRAQQLLDQIKRMPAGYFSFTIADATFTGTEAGAGQAAAYAVARFLGNMPQSVALHATNFVSLSILGMQNPTTFANYNLPTKLTGDAKQSSYALTQGFVDPAHATAIFREEKLPTAMIAEMEKHLAKTL